ncbi:hypothetical protein B0H11DRAFT_2233785 [Mycena galericulata]|nr:hypothetical protein B0H11DRAFT_2233785 [Mycena galericulata]
MAILITVRCAIDTFRCVIALENNGVDFGPPNTNVGIATNACWVLLAAVADAFIIFRTFIVWNRNWFVIIVPSMLFLGCVGIWIMLSLKGFNPERGSIFQTLIPKNGAIVTALALATNLICNGLILFRLFSRYRQIAALSSNVAGHSNNMKIISILVESATLYTLFLMGILIAAGLNSYVTYILIDCTSPITGLVVLVYHHPRPTAQNPPSELHFRLQQATHQRSDLVLEDVILAGEDKIAEYANAPPV